MSAGLKLKTCCTAWRDLLIAHLAGAERINEDADRLRVADGVGHLQLGDGGEAGGHDVLRDPAAHVGGGAVHLGRILAREGAAAVAAPATVGVDDDLAAGEARNRPAGRR
jgi:hypothetical protein